jgi:hypothetical protein
MDVLEENLPLANSRARLGQRLHKLEALRQFREDLKEARAEFEQDKAAGHVMALYAAWYFLKALDPSDQDGVHQLFLERAVALSDDRKGKSLYDLALMAQVAAGVQSLVERGAYPEARSGKAKAEMAAKDMAKVFSRCGAPAPGKPDTPAWKGIFYWWTNFEKGNYDSIAMELYDHNRQELARYPELTPEKLRADLTTHLNRLGWGAPKS